MKILLLCWRDSTHPQGGGSERYLERVAEHLSERGHEVIFRTAASENAPATSIRGGVRFRRAGGRLSVYPRAWLAMLAGRCGIGELRGVDVVVDTQNGIPFFARLCLGAPTVVLTHHCHREQWPVAGPGLAQLGWFLESIASPRVYRHARWVTVSEASAAELRELGVRDISVIHNGVDPVPLFDAAPPAPAPRLVTLSRLVPHKQIEHAIEVADSLGVELDVIGSGWWEENLRDIAGENVHFHGHVSEETKHALLDRADVHLMPSRKEGWGLAVVEAAQHGVPTIGYRSSRGLCDSVIDGQTGLLVDSPEQLAAATAELINDPQRRAALGEAARQRAQRYSWATTGAAFAELLERVARA
ncbi:GDP-mannose-dependent alpha-(1-6)-phosphatidylinositol monomannoside mannosyltransferase [Corynebacterium ciconiae DSM 44920]|uniref:glycosyltransferase family 4 protein n=1 Tax=Corynebacterium ciconiae TaxID=227319 RepID=UPI000366F78F|nr:glycosyltransferase family 4 protein [Corynebacterium ciconiae]WKD60257.1 GDP-mannose-dependent alpha-(1-6)-phosphatidylinositol monomannoside mannosyltransferase [Corynebacterium ciconiae DSM 44920]